MDDYTKIKFKIDSGEYTVLKRESRSKVYQIFYEIIDSNGEAIKNLLQCTWCKNIYKSRTNTSNLVKHSCYRKYKDIQEQQTPKLEPSIELKVKCMELVVQWIVGGCRPCNIVKDEGLYSFVEFLISTGHRFGNNIDVKDLVPNPSIVARNIASLYDDQRETLKQELISNKNIGFSITCDLLNDKCLQTSYVGATVHYMKAGCITNKVLGLREVGNGNGTGCNVRNTIGNILKDFDCELNQMVTVVTSEESTMNDTFQHDRRIICINHLLNSVIVGAVSDTAEVNSITTTCSRLVTYLKKSDENSLLNTALENYTATRWNTVFYLLELVQQNWDDINQALQEKNMTSRIADINLVDIIEILGILRPFEEASKLLASENIPTIHHVYPHIRKLKTISSKMHPNESELIKKFKEKLLFYMETVIDPNLQDLHKIAIFLFPPANKLHNFTENEKRKIRDKCKEMLIAYEESRSNMDIKTEFQDVDADLDIFSDFVQPTGSPECNDVLASEILRYERQTVLYFKQFDPLKWWDTHKHEYPLLYKLCCFVLATPASSAISAKMFSKAPHLLSEPMHERETAVVEQILFLHSNLDLNADHPDHTNQANQDDGVEIKSPDFDSDSDNSKCSTPKIKKHSTPPPV